MPDQDVGTPVSSLPVSGSQSRFVEDLGTDSEETGTGNTADIDVTAEQDSPSRSVQVGGGAESENAKTTENVLASAVSEPEAISQTQVQDVSLPAPAILEQSHSPAEQSAPFVPEEEQPAQEGAEATTEEVSGDVHDGVPETTILRNERDEAPILQPPAEETQTTEAQREPSEPQVTEAQNESSVED